jgi:2'-5' RNA ligase
MDRELAERRFGSIELKEVELFQSELLSSGPRYTSLATARLRR